MHLHLKTTRKPFNNYSVERNVGHFCNTVFKLYINSKKIGIMNDIFCFEMKIIHYVGTFKSHFSFQNGKYIVSKTLSYTTHLLNMLAHKYFI